METFSQDDRPLVVTTPLGQDALLLEGFCGTAALSQLFRYQLDLLAPRGMPVSFEAILGQPIRVQLRLEDGNVRYFHGIVSRFQRGRRSKALQSYRAEMV